MPDTDMWREARMSGSDAFTLTPLSAELMADDQLRALAFEEAWRQARAQHRSSGPADVVLMLVPQGRARGVVHAIVTQGFAHGDTSMPEPSIEACTCDASDATSRDHCAVHARAAS